ncbi:hypothetical protein [Paenibacillus sp. NPDC057934]|uniref:HNH endonuclease n=1 Tax=Paenibacillus sp. NPDC057934 TaxID=3346282 RepID=UPI0036D9BDE6
MRIQQWRWEYIERNMLEFNRGLHTKSFANKKFNMFYHWYYHPILDLFAPSKFIGYSNTNHENYKGEGDGGQTQKTLKNYFDPVSIDEYEFYLDKLTKYADSFGHRLSKRLSTAGGGWVYIPNKIVDCFIENDKSYEVDIDNEEALFKEGEGKRVTVNKYERDPKLKKAAILIHGVTCMGCEFNFEEHYGEYGKGFIEIHHLESLASVKGEHYVDPKEGIAVLCSNCHRMVHRKKDTPLTLEQLMVMIKSNKV